MPTTSGNALPHTAEGHRPIPLADQPPGVRPAHAPQTPKPTGLDWTRLHPTCPACGTTSSTVRDDGCNHCLTIRKKPQPATVQAASEWADTYTTDHPDDLAARFNAPTTPPPAPAPAPPKPTVRAKIRATSTHDVVITLRSTTHPLQQTHVAALLNDLLHALQTPRGGTAPPITTGVPSDTASTADTDAQGAPTPAPRPAAGFTTFKRADRKPPISDFPLNRALELLHQGHTTPRIAEQLDCAVATVRRHLKAAGATIPDGRAVNGGRNRITTPEQTAAIIRAYTHDQQTLAAISHQHGVSPRTIQRILTDNHVTVRPPRSQPRTLTDADIDQAAQLYRDGATLAEIARTLHVKRDRIRAAVLERGVPLRRAGGPKEPNYPHGAAPATIRAWAHANGVLDPNNVSGRLPKHAIHAYQHAHPTTQKENQHDA